ncbi:galactoside 2-alpha-L-fucosyltransferase 2 [Heterocephalus glaber]|uniref:L-Fucosyltransferase n=1 Tax=Heterocephalus glaber TaxID=10181 RepID=A0AAX6RXD4_HETGA|nr:galactoside 2-alpha-L-fucosyltransferase 2 [Heterocephalus glaber]
MKFGPAGTTEPPAESHLSSPLPAARGAMARAQGSFFFPMAHVILFVFITSTLFHLQQRLMQTEPRRKGQKLQSALPPPGSERLAAPKLEGMWTINAIGRLGNQMGQYATLYALAKMNGRPAYIPAVFKPEAAFLPEWVGIAADLSPLLKH